MEVSVVDKKRTIQLKVLLIIALVLVLISAGITSLIWYIIFRLRLKFEEDLSFFPLNELEPNPNLKLQNEELVAKINQNFNTWKAKFNPVSAINWKSEIQPFADFNLQRRKLKNFDIVLKQELGMNFSEFEENYLKNLPEEFDARIKWPLCNSLHFIANQGACGSCWAFCAATMLSDRICIHSNGFEQPQLAVEDILQCCFSCNGKYTVNQASQAEKFFEKSLPTPLLKPVSLAIDLSL